MGDHNTCTTGNSSVQPNNRPGSINTFIRDANGSKPSAGQNTSNFGSDCDDNSTGCFSEGDGDNLMLFVVDNAFR